VGILVRVWENGLSIGRFWLILVRVLRDALPVHNFVLNVAEGGEFTIEVHHGGFFVSYGNLRTYVDG
jgi:hypothetical protein